MVWSSHFPSHYKWMAYNDNDDDEDDDDYLPTEQDMYNDPDPLEHMQAIEDYYDRWFDEERA